VVLVGVKEIALLLESVNVVELFVPLKWSNVETLLKYGSEGTLGVTELLAVE
jgi:hypothetical protein